MNELRDMYLKRTDGDYTAAAVAFAFDLMQDDPGTFKQGYTLENAAIASHDVFRNVSRLTIQEQVARKVGITR